MLRSTAIVMGQVLLLALSSTCLSETVFTPFTIETGFANPGSVCAADIDGDGDNDVLGAAVDGNQVAWWRNDGGNPVAWTKFIIADAFGGAISVYAADVDGDSRMDVLAAGYNRNQIAWWRNNGGDPITWTKQAIGNYFMQAHEVYACDLDNDGDTDVLGASILNNTVAWWRNDGGSPIVWTLQTFSTTFKGARSIRAADFDGDGDNDVVGAALIDNKLTWWRNDGGSPILWTEITITSSFAGSHMVRTCDLDNDGDIDLVAAAYVADQIAWWRNDGGDPVAWTKQTISADMDGALSISMADLDEDGNVDVVGTAQFANDLAWWSNDGGSPITWTAHMIDGNFGGVWPVYTADIDGDAHTDVVSGGDTFDEVKWWRNEPQAGAPDPSNGAGGAGSFLYQNSPNPFKPGAGTSIRFDLARDSEVKIAVNDVRGRLVRTLVRGWQSAGPHQVDWDGLDGRGSLVAPGVYFTRMVTEGYSATRPAIVTK